ncbi:MAG: D-aminoacyl-tRNA deacylase [Marinirhabdus sp.]
MRTVIQRVKKASVTVAGKPVSAMQKGLLILLGVATGDTQEDVDWLARKIARLRIFEDENGAMNKSVLEIGGEVLVVSQFTLHASVKKGNRPSFIKAARPGTAGPLYEKFVAKLQNILGNEVQTGIFGAMMEVALTNDGPVTIVIDSKNRE